MSGFTDYHAHFVYGVDDGARTREEMYAMLDAAVQDGVSWKADRSFCILRRRGMQQLSVS